MNNKKETTGYCSQCQTLQLIPISGAKTGECPLCSKTYTPTKEKRHTKEKQNNGQLSLFCSGNLQNSELEK